MNNLRNILLASVTSLTLLCKPAWAEVSDANREARPSIIDGFSLGGYSSASMIVPRHDSVELALEDISLFVRWENESRLKFFGELELENPLTWNEDSRFSKKNAYVDLERLYFDYNVSEKLNFRAGRFLTPAGRWNLLHAAPLVWTSTRPLVTSRLFPASTNGLMLYGNTTLQNNALEYTVFVETLKDQVKDKNEIAFRDVAGAHFTLNNPLNLGLTLMTLREVDPHTPSNLLVGFDFLTKLNHLELSGEAYYRFTSQGNNGGNGAYLQSAYHLGSEWYALARLETFQSPSDGTAERWLVGASKRLKSNQLLKMEFVGGSGNLPDAPRGFVGSYAVLF
ncbi:MAG: hypothetical protein HOP21_11895 [Methylotenera sp.]|nr:hypothetical protein [Methylotenera sp.]